MNVCPDKFGNNNISPDNAGWSILLDDSSKEKKDK